MWVAYGGQLVGMLLDILLSSLYLFLQYFFKMSTTASNAVF